MSISTRFHFLLSRNAFALSTKLALATILLLGCHHFSRAVPAFSVTVFNYTLHNSLVLTEGSNCHQKDRCWRKQKHGDGVLTFNESSWFLDCSKILIYSSVALRSSKSHENKMIKLGSPNSVCNPMHPLSRSVFANFSLQLCWKTLFIHLRSLLTRVLCQCDKNVHHFQEGNRGDVKAAK